MAKMLLKGTSRRSAEEIAIEIESVGGSIDSYGGNNSFGVNAEVLSGDFGLGLDLLSDVLLDPAFPVSALEREREVQLASIRAQRDQPLQSASKAMRRCLFGEQGYGLDLTGSEESVRKIQVADLKGIPSKTGHPGQLRPGDLWRCRTSGRARCRAEDIPELGPRRSAPR